MVVNIICEKGVLFAMGKIIIIAGMGLCLIGITSLILAVIFFGNQRAKLVDQINNEYKEQ